MFQHLTTPVLLETARQQITALLREHAEWFFTLAHGDTHALRRSEIDIEISQDRLLLSCWTEKGRRSWRILGWHWTGQTLRLQASRRMGAERPLIELIPRASATAVAATIRAARQVRCDQLAQLAGGLEAETKIERSALSPGIRRGQPGRYARILLRRKRTMIAVTGSVVSSHPAAVDAFLSSALLWFKRTAERIRPPYVEQLWLVVSKELVKPTLYRVSLLRDSLRDLIKVFEVDDALATLKAIPCIDRRELWKNRVASFPPVPAANLTERTRAIIAEAPPAIDVVHARHGETLRYFGLPFARVRELLGTERVWFGTEGSHRRLLDQTTTPDWQNLLRDLQEHRSADALDHRHALYRNAA